MITSDEPGLYIEGKHGIRTENLILCVEDEKNEYGQFLRFEYLTYVPIDVEAIDKSLMTEQDVEYLNQYHRAVYEKISPYLTAEEAGVAKRCDRCYLMTKLYTPESDMPAAKERQAVRFRRVLCFCIGKVN